MTERTPDFKAFEAQLSKLQIEVSRSADGLLTVCSSSEPLFCYDAHDEEAVKELVKDTLRSYGRHFFGIPDAHISTKCSPVGKVAIPVDRAERISTIEPVLDQAA